MVVVGGGGGGKLGVISYGTLDISRWRVMYREPGCVRRFRIARWQVPTVKTTPPLMYKSS